MNENLPKEKGKQRHENFGKTNAIHRIQPISEISSRCAKILETAGFVRIQPFWVVAVTRETPLRYGPQKRRYKTAGFSAPKKRTGS
jgi:hypothetical protein